MCRAQSGHRSGAEGVARRLERQRNPERSDPTLAAGNALRTLKLHLLPQFTICDHRSNFHGYVVEGTDEFAGEVLSVSVYDAAGKITYADSEAVFTVETSVRTAMMAVYKTMYLDRPITPLKIN